MQLIITRHKILIVDVQNYFLQARRDFANSATNVMKRGDFRFIHLLLVKKNIFTGKNYYLLVLIL